MWQFFSATLPPLTPTINWYLCFLCTERVPYLHAAMCTFAIQLHIPKQYTHARRSKTNIIKIRQIIINNRSEPDYEMIQGVDWLEACSLSLLPLIAFSDGSQRSIKRFRPIFVVVRVCGSTQLWLNSREREKKMFTQKHRQLRFFPLVVPSTLRQRSIDRRQPSS